MMLNNSYPAILNKEKDSIPNDVNERYITKTLITNVIKDNETLNNTSNST